MTKSRKRKTPIVTMEKGSNTSLSARNMIREYHVLLKRKAQLASESKLEQVSEEIDGKIAELGGLERYQRMSAIGQRNDRGGGSEKVLIEWLKTMGLHKHRSSRLLLLEVGALTPDNYRTCLSWIEPTPIDLRSRHPSILEQDFMLLDRNGHSSRWDIISLSLILNFVPVAKERGRMLRLSYEFLKPSGFLFLVLPLPCVNNSRYLDFASLKLLMCFIGFTELKVHWKNGQRMAYWLYQKGNSPGSLEPFMKKTVLRQGNRNNFSILL